VAAAAIAAAAARQPIAAVLHAEAVVAGRVPAQVTLKRCAPVPRLPEARLRARHQLRTQHLAAVVADIKVAADIKAAVVAGLTAAVVTEGINL